MKTVDVKKAVDEILNTEDQDDAYHKRYLLYLNIVEAAARGQINIEALATIALKAEGEENGKESEVLEG